MQMFKPSQHPALSAMSKDDKESASRTAKRMSIEEVKAAQNIYNQLYAGIAMPREDGDLILAHISNTYGYPRQGASPRT